MRNPAVLVSSVGGAAGSREAAAVIACARSAPDRACLLVDVGDGRPPRPTPLATVAARELERRLGAHMPDAVVAARGRVCQLLLSSDSLDRLGAALALARDPGGVVHLPPGLLQQGVALPAIETEAVVLRAELERDRPLVALAAGDLMSRGVRVAVIKHRLRRSVALQALFGMLSGESADDIPARVRRLCLPQAADFTAVSRA
jgi:hypothetical protein